MKKLLLILSMSLAVFFTTQAQTATNADGSLKLRGNVAIMVTGHSFTFSNGAFEKKISDESLTELKSTFNALAIQKFGNACFGIVNRDNVAYSNVRKVLEEQKLEDYIDGFSVQAKGEGADCLFLNDITIYNENNETQLLASCRFINITTNTGFHYAIKSKPVLMSDSNEMSRQIKDLVQQYGNFLDQRISDIYPEQYGVVKAEGKKLYLSAYQPNGRILPTDKFYAFNFSKETMSLGGGKEVEQVLNEIAIATDATNENGYCVVKSDKAFKPTSEIVLFKNQKEPMVTTAPMTFTYFALTYDSNTYEGFIKNRVNNAVYESLTRHPGAMLIEQEHLPELKKERELQKTEDFIDGHVVEQMKSIGAQYLLHLENFMMKGSLVSFQMNLVSIEQNRILRSVEVSSSIDNIENEMYKQICERLSYPCNITMIGKNSMDILSGWSLSEGTDIIIQYNKPIRNPMTKEVSYSKVNVCKCSVIKYKGNRFLAQVSKVFIEDDFKNLCKNSMDGLVSIQIDGTSINTNVSEKSDVVKEVEKQEKKEKRKAFLNTLGNALMEGVQVK